MRTKERVKRRIASFALRALNRRGAVQSRVAKRQMREREKESVGGRGGLLDHRAKNGGGYGYNLADSP